ncbi:hypothetical protein [Emticicia fontis]
MKTNQLSQKHLEVFNRAGWVVQTFKENELIELFGQETFLYIHNYKGLTTRSIMIDYGTETLAVLESDNRTKKETHTHYDSHLPEEATGTIAIFGVTKVIDNQLLQKLLNA